jgi:hypothetical protein
MDENIYLLADFTTCKFSNGKESIILEKLSNIQERTSGVPCKFILILFY